MADVDSNAVGFAMLASGVAGMRLSIARLEAASGATYSDGRTIFLGESAWDSNAALQVLIQAALIHAGALDGSIVRLLAGRPKIARRYLLLESQRAVKQLQDRLPRRLVEEPALTSDGVASDSPAQSIAIATSNIELPDPPEFCGSLRPLKIIFASHANPQHAPAASSAPRGRMRDLDIDELDEQRESEDSKILKLFSNPLASGAGPISSLLRKLLGMGRKPNLDSSSRNGGGAELPMSGAQKSLTRGVNALLSLLPADLQFRDPSPSARAFAYPEWDEFAARYKPAWTFVEEFLPGEPGDRTHSRENFIEPSRTLYRSLARLGFSHEQHPHQRLGDHIDVDALVRMVISVRARQQADERIYHTSLRTRRDLGVMLLVDVSGSSGEGAGVARRVHDDQIRLCYQLAQVLERLGDQVAVYGFQSWGRTAVRFLQVKAFQERFDGTVLERLAMLEPGGYTRTGAAIRHASKLLKDYSGAPYKLLTVISDGFAYDDGYEGNYGESDTRRALQETRDQRIGCVCVSVGGEVESERLTRVFGTASCLRVAKPEDAAPHVGALFSAAIKRASTRRIAA